MEVFLRDLRPITSINEKVLKELSLANTCDREDFFIYYRVDAF